MSSNRFYQCTKDSVEVFRRYDRNVDIVTSWEYLSKPYRTHFPDFNFDRFPSYNTGDEGWKNPNFTMFFDERYGIAFETYHRSGIIDTPALLNKELEKIKSLDEDLQFESRDGRYVEPRKYDIALLIGSSQSQTFGHILEEEIDKGNLDLESNLVLLEFDYVERDQPLYRFKRMTHPDQNFRDEALPKMGSLRHRLSNKGERFEHITAEIDEDFVELKATGMFTSRQTSDLYLACRLWDTVLKDKLDDEEWDIWRKGDHNKKIPKVVSCSELANDINNKYAPGANFSSEDVKDALRFIAVAKRAEQVSGEEFQIQYSNLKDKRREHKDTSTDRSDVNDLAYLLSSWYCETKVGNSLREIAEIISAESYNKADLSGISGDEVINL